MASTLPSDFLEARASFEKLAATAKLLKEYDAPAKKRIVQLQEIGQTAVWMPFYPMFNTDCLNSTSSLASLLSFSFLSARTLLNSFSRCEASIMSSIILTKIPSRLILLIMMVFASWPIRSRRSAPEFKKNSARKRLPPEKYVLHSDDVSSVYRPKLYPKSVKSKAIIDSDDEVEIITGNEAQNLIDGNASDKVYLEALSKGLMKVLTKTLAQMQVDDDERPAHDIGTVPKSLHFKKIKVTHECAHEDHPEASCPSTQVILPIFLSNNLV